jgi:GDP-mannose 6-dehydrogenase
MHISPSIKAVRPIRARFEPVVIGAKPAISVVGLGYVGAGTCGCLTALGHRVVGMDADPDRTVAIGAGRTPIHEAGLEDLLAEGVAAGLLQVTGDLAGAMAATDVTFVSVGTPTAKDGGCDTRQLAAAADGIGAALRGKAGFLIVVPRFSVLPGTTQGLVAQRIARASGKAAGAGFGTAFVPEFLREGVAVRDFHEPPKTVISASDARTAATVARIFAPVDADPLMVGVETAELVKSVGSVSHAAKVCFANEVGRLAKSLGVDGREVMEVFCRDTKLNLSAAYLKPGFAYGGSCLQNEVRAVAHLAARNGVQLPMVDSLGRSNAVQIAEALWLVRATGASRVGVLGLAFKPGTDDLRESPILELIAGLAGEGVALIAHDRAVISATPIARQLAYVANGAGGLGRLARDLPAMLADSPASVITGSDAVIVTHADPAYRAALAGAGLPVIDLDGLFGRDVAPAACAGIGW